MSLKIYCAGSWKDRERIKLTWINRLRELGHEITHDWTEMEDNRMDKIGNPLRDIDYHAECAVADIQGVKDADLLMVVMDSAVDFYNYRGTWTEIGAGLMKEIPIILYNPWIDEKDINEMAKYSRNVTNVFFWSPGITRVTTGNQAFREIAKYAETFQNKSKSVQN